MALKNKEPIDRLDVAIGLRWVVDFLFYYVQDLLDLSDEFALFLPGQ